MRARERMLGAALVGATVLGVAVADVRIGPRAIQAQRAASADELAARAPEDEAAREALRARGAAGLRALLAAHAPDVARLRAGDGEGLEALRAAIDAVSGQRDGHASGLFWHTDLDAARREAARRGVPILSLRLLGRLDEELSCANSRYFRVVLYADPEVARAMSREFVLHWSSERPAPVITIDMGDGRTLRRTITGNSVHYVLDADGRPLDAIVGLYGPQGFRAALDDAREVHRRCTAASDRAACLAEAHREQRREARARWARSIDGPSFDAARRPIRPSAPGPAPAAAIAMPLTIRKAFVETPALEAMGAPAPPRPPEPDWAAFGVALHGLAELSDSSRALLRLKTGRTDVQAIARRLAEDARADGVRNEVHFRDVVRQWFEARDASTRALDALNRRVYAELLLTPASDPWLGLRSDDLYDGIEPGD